MSAVALPTPSTGRRVFVWGIVGLLLAFGIAKGVFWFMGSSTASASTVSGTFQLVSMMDLDVRLIKDGELHAVNNIEVINKVEGINTIQELVKEGTYVHKGDTLVVLDSSNIQKNYDMSLLDLQNAEASLAAAKESKEIQEAANKANLAAAELDLEVSKIDIEEYTDGLAPQKEAEARIKVRMAEITVKNKEEDLATTRNLFSKGFVTAVDVKKGELDLLTGQNDLKKAETELKVLLEFTHKKNLAQKRSNVAQAQQRVERVRKENMALMNKLTTALLMSQQTLELRQQLTNKLKEQLDNCTIKAPADGMVVYASTSDRYGSSEPIKEGGNVRNMQVLLRLPDTSTMKAVIQVPEGKVAKLRVDDNDPMRATVNITGISKPFGASIAKISVLADSSQRWINPDLKQYPVELLLDETPPNCKPGMSCAVDILMERRPKVPVIPLPAIYAQGNQSFAFARNGSGVKPVEIIIGATNDTHAEIKSGVAMGQEVLLLQPGQGRALLEKAGIHVQPPSRPGDAMKKPQRPKRNGNGGGPVAPPAARLPAERGGAKQVSVSVPKS